MKEPEKSRKSINQQTDKSTKKKAKLIPVKQKYRNKNYWLSMEEEE